MKYVNSFLWAALVTAILALVIAIAVAACQEFGPEGILFPMLFLIVWRITHSFIEEVL